MDYVTQSIELKGVANARQLGGYLTEEGRRVKKDVLLRTGGLFRAEEGAVKALEEKYLLSDIVDLRMKAEVSVMPDPTVKGAKYHHFSILEELPIKEEEFQTYLTLMSIEDVGQRYAAIYDANFDIDMEGIYISMVFGTEGKKGYKKLFDVLLSKEEKAAVLFHCTQGKDRTGMGAMLILGTLGVDEATIKEDYLLTNEAYKPTFKRIEECIKSASLDENVLKFAMLLEGVRLSYIDAAYNKIKAEYGDILGYVTKELGLSKNDVEDFKKMYLE